MTQRAIDGPYVYFVTTNTTFRRQVFWSEQNADLLGGVIRTACNEFGFCLCAFSILPDHVHLLVQKREAHPLSELMKFIKGRFSRTLTPGRIWKPRYYFRIIEREDYLLNVIIYIQYNFRKTGLDEKYGRSPFVFLDWEQIYRLFQ